MRPHLILIAPIFAWALGCSETADPGGSSGGGGGVPAAGQGGSAGAPPTGGISSGGGGTTSTGGTASGASGASGSATGGQGGTAGASDGSGGASGGEGGTSATAGAGGMPAGSGGMPTGGSGGMGGRGGNGGSGGGSTTCTRELLSSTTNAYFTALAANDPSSLPLATNVKFTENGEVMDLGEEGLWQTAGALVYKHTAIDVQECSAMSQAVVPDGNTNIPVALRLKLVSGQITEIETIAVRSGDYPLAASNTTALAASDDMVGWEDSVPAADRQTREELVGWMNKYFRMFPAGVCNTTSACRRIENGGGNFMCSAGGSCSPNQPGPNDDELVPRLILADVETGVGIGFTMFQGTYTDMHMFKMHGAEVHWVSAVLGQAGSPGW